LQSEVLALAWVKDIDSTAALALALADDSEEGVKLAGRSTNTTRKHRRGSEVLPKLRAAATLKSEPRRAISILAISRTTKWVLTLLGLDVLRVVSEKY
jgi:hypothetical protein